MKFRTTAGALLLMAGMLNAGGNHPQLTGAMPPDPVTVDRFAGPMTPASLTVWRMTATTSEFMWRLLKASESLSTPQLRTLSLDLLRVRRFYDHESPADWLMTSAWADREPVTAVRELLWIPDWEDLDENIGDYDSDVEHLASWFWVQLAERDFPAALRLAGNMKGAETIGQFFEYISDADFSAKEAAEIVQLAARLGPEASAPEIARQWMRHLSERHGPGAAHQMITELPEGNLREQAVRDLRRLEASPPASAKEAPALPPVRDPRLASLLTMDAAEPKAPFPFPLFRAVRLLAPADARQLLEHLPEARLRVGWLGWLLAMRANEGVTDPSLLHPVTPPNGPWIDSGRRPNPVIAAKTEDLLAKAAATGYEAALVVEATAFRISPEEASEIIPPAYDVMQAWALSDFPAAIAYVSKEKDPAKRATYAGALDGAMHRLSCAAVLPSLPPSLWGELSMDPWRHFIPFEDLEAGFHYFERHGALLRGEAADFLATAVRFDPVRPITLAREKNLDLRNVAGGLATHWPDRIGDLLKPEDGKEVWGAVARSLARHHPEKVIAILKTQPFLEPWKLAELEFSLHPSTRPELIRELKSIIPGKTAAPSKQKIPDPFAEGR